jgi:magnesium chelatase family protein
VRSRVIAARARQLERQGKPNCELTARETDKQCRADAAATALLKSAIVRLNLSARAYHRVLRLALTIADVAGADMIAPAHVAEAVQYRRGDRAA